MQLGPEGFKALGRVTSLHSLDLSYTVSLTLPGLHTTPQGTLRGTWSSRHCAPGSERGSRARR